MSPPLEPALSGPAEAALLPLRPRWKYLALALCAMQRLLAYRSAVFLGLLTSLMWVVIQYALWSALFTGREQVGAFDWPRMQTYLLLSFGVNALLSATTEQRMFSMIRMGNVVFELARPVDYLGSQLAQAAGSAIIEGAMGALVVTLLALTLFDAQGPVSPALGALFLASVALGFLIKFLISYLVALLCFRFLNVLGLLWMRAAISNILSGALVPLELLPEPLRTASWLLPFRGIIHTPISLYLGLHDAAAYPLALLHQLLWVVLLWGLARRLWAVCLRSFVIQGG
ncbi:MAG TPA: ABC-2 family transporter protein [Myxococcaceae bacterium]|jgi:ABC-2 type transport system permease protein